MKRGHRFSKDEVLRYSLKPKSRTTVSAYYRKWREVEGIPTRCGNERCAFFAGTLVWNGKILPAVVDHRNGNRNDNTTQNLRLLCPNCDSQNDTRGGRNIGRIQNPTATGYEVANRDGTRDANVFPAGLGVTASLGSVTPVSETDEDA